MKYSARENLKQGLAHHQTGKIEKAQHFYKKVIKTNPKSADALHLLGVTYRQLGHTQLALDHIQRAIEIDPNQSAFYANLARTMMDLNTEAKSLLAVCDKALCLNSKEKEARNIKAVALTKLDRYEEAEHILQELIVEFNDYTEAYNNYGKLLMEANRENHAIVFFSKSILLAPNNPNNHVLRARCRMKLQQYEPAQLELSEALERFPDNGDIEHEAARLLFLMNESSRSVEYARKSLKSDPNNVQKAVTLGVGLLMARQSAESLKVLRRSHELEPTNKTVQWNLSLAYLSNGDLMNGWKYHKARFEDPACTTVHKRIFDVPSWSGEDISSKTILLWTDQGLGDALRSGTMLSEIAKLAANVKVELSEKAARFMRYSFPEVEFRSPILNKDLVSTANDFDLHCNISDLAEFLRPDLQSFHSARRPAYSFEKERAIKYLNRIPEHIKKPVIGFSWRSKNLTANRARFYLSAPNIAPVLESRDALFVNLQYRAIDKEIAFFDSKFPDGFRHFDDVDLFDDLLGAAALTACCDIVVSANTSVADMAGLLDVPCIRFGQHESALLLGQNNPPWYPSMTYMHPYVDRACADFVPEIIKELDKQLADWNPERRNKRLGLS